MKKDDIKKAFDSVSANDDLKEKVFLRLEKELDPPSKTETFQINTKKGGSKRFAAASFCTAAAIIMTLVLSRTVFNIDITDEITDVSEETTASADPLPENITLVTLRVIDENGQPVKNVRVDYLPMKVDVSEPSSGYSDFSSVHTSCDTENLDKAGTIPMTYGEDMELEIAYGDYNFYVSSALPNSSYRIRENSGQPTIVFPDDMINPYFPYSVSVDENTAEITLPCFVPEEQYKYVPPKLGVILRDAQGNVPSDEYTVILKPVNGEMQEGYNDCYGGYVLTRTDENGEAFWIGTPIEGEYEVIAYKERLHTADEPVTEPFAFDGDNTVTYSEDSTVSVYEKTFKQAE